MNFFKTFKLVKDVLNASVDAYTLLQDQACPNNNLFEAEKSTTSLDYEKAVFDKLIVVDFFNNKIVLFKIYELKNNMFKPIYYVIFVEREIIVFKTSNLNAATHVCDHLNSLQTVLRNSEENHLLNNFLKVALIHKDWRDVHLACYLGLSDFIKKLCIASNSSLIVNIPTIVEGYYPIHLAAEKGFLSVVNHLLHFGANITKCDLQGRNTLHFCVQKHSIESCVIIKVLAKNDPQSFKIALEMPAKADNLNPLQLACQTENLDVLNQFLKFDFKAARINCDILFSLELNPMCLDLLLKYDPDLIFCLRKPSFILHQKFLHQILKVIACRVPLALKQRYNDLDNKTLLHVAIECFDLNTVVALLSYGADIGLVDAKKNSALHYAVKVKSVRIVQLLLCFGADAYVKNKKGETPINLPTTVEIANIFKQIAAWNKIQQVNEKDISNLGNIRQSQALQYQLKLLNDAKSRENSLRLLSLDGGGIRGLVLIQILLELENQLGKGPGALLKHFDWIAGTSTGAILALTLADGVPLQDCLRLYLRLKDEVFASSKQTIKPEAGPNSSLTSTESTICMYSAEAIEFFLKKQFSNNRSMMELKNDVRVMVTATRANVNPPELIIFRNYSAPESSYSNLLSAENINYPTSIPIWKAARCSSAAPFYFPSVDGEIIDGGLIANNPSLDLLTEVELYNSALCLQGKPEKNICCLVSIGSGRLPKMPLEEIDLVTLRKRSNLFGNILNIMKNITVLQNLKNIFVEQVACSDGQVLKRAQAWAHSLKTPFFRFTPQLSVEVALDTTDNDALVNLLWTTKVYVNTECQYDISLLIDFLLKF